MKALVVVCALLAAPAAAAQETTTYTYDALGRLQESQITQGPNTGTDTKIEYDSAGNRKNYVVTGATGTPSSGTKVIVVPLNGFTVIPLPNPWAAR